MAFPARRLRRLRGSDGLRELTMDIRISPADLVCPIFVDGSGSNVDIKSMPGMSRLAPSAVAAEAGELAEHMMTTG